MSQGVVLVGITAIVSVVIINKVRSVGSSKSEAQQLRQIYQAAVLYKGDNDGKLPESIVTLRTTNYLPEGALTNSHDHRRGLKVADWPANPWIRQPIFLDPPHLTHARYKELNSYAFLPTWKSRYNYPKPFEEVLETPNMGLITGLGLMDCRTILGFPSCYYSSKDPVVDLGQPSLNLSGTVMSIRIDGSLVTRQRAPFEGTADMSMEQLFMFYRLQGGPAVMISASKAPSTTK